MIRDLTTKDRQLVIKLLFASLFDKAESYFQEQILAIARKNQEAKNSPLLTFTFGGEVFKFEHAEVRFPQSLARFLYPEMHELMAHRRKVMEEEGAYVMTALTAAVSRCETVSHLYQLLPELLHPSLREMGVREEIDLDNFKPLTDAQVQEFKTKHAYNLDKLFQRATKNTLGVYV